MYTSLMCNTTCTSEAGPTLREKGVSKQNRKLRIIGGEWRRRNIEFPDVDAIRPTPDRIRETLFNWLQGELHGAKCLEPFAGSGILSIEALSRGAKHCTVIDQAGSAVKAIQENLEVLGSPATSLQGVVTNAYDWLQNQNEQRYDLIFLDPPFAEGDYPALLKLCADLLVEDGKLYVESPAALESSVSSDGLELLKQKRAGSVHYALFERCS